MKGQANISAADERTTPSAGEDIRDRVQPQAFPWFCLIFCGCVVAMFLMLMALCCVLSSMIREQLVEREHRVALRTPAYAIRESVRDIASSVGLCLKDPEAILAKLDNEKFEIRTGAWKFVCSEANVSASLGGKLAAKGMPVEVITGILKTLQIDDEASLFDRKFVVDGRNSLGHMYSFRLRSVRSRGKMSVALMVSAISFDMKKVVDHYETSEEAVFEQVPIPKPPAQQSCDETWFFFLGSKRCYMKEAPQQYTKRFVKMAETKFPIYSHRALPEGVTQKDVMHALDVVVSREAQKVLAA